MKEFLKLEEPESEEETEQEQEQALSPAVQEEVVTEDNNTDTAETGILSFQVFLPDRKMYTHEVFDGTGQFPNSFPKKYPKIKNLKTCIAHIGI